MLYDMFQAANDALLPARVAATAAAAALRPFGALDAAYLAPRSAAAALDVFTRSVTTHKRPHFGIETIEVGNRQVAVIEEVAGASEFGSLLHFRKDSEVQQPKLLLVAPMSGHFATLLRGTVRTLLLDHDVYITDWHNARDVPVAAGRFGLDDYIEHVIDFLEILGPGAHVMAVCQPTVPVLAAVAVMAAQNNPAQPRSMTLMAGPIDPRINPTTVNRLAHEHSFEWFEKNVITSVPLRYAGAGRRVYPGFLQLTAFVSMNFGRHAGAQIRQFANLVRGDASKAAQHDAFYDEYLAVMDLPAEFYLETIKHVFQEAALPRGTLTYRGEVVDPGVIRRTALMTVEGELDDISAVGQTTAALDLCSGLRPAMKFNYLQTGVGHYGTFNGKRWVQGIYPRVRAFIQTAA
jgi:poly(3-hydroxybutyrate) depolymerase